MAVPGRAGGYLSALTTALLLCVAADLTLGDDWEARKLYCSSQKENTTIYDYPINIGISASPLDWNHYRGNIVMVVNVASFWGYTFQYIGLNALQQKYQNFRIIGFPCNLFEYQEPGTAQEILNCIKYVRPGGGVEPKFNLTEKIDVNGPAEHVIFTHLKGLCPSPTTVFSGKESLMYDTFRDTDIRWNFEKILLNRDGHPVVRFNSAVQPEDMVPDIEKLLNEQN